MCTIFGTKMAQFVLKKLFLVQNIVITFIYLLALFIVQNLKNYYNKSRIMMMHHFWAQNCPFTPNNVFLENYYYHSHLPIRTFHCSKLKKKFFQQIQSLFLFFYQGLLLRTLTTHRTAGEERGPSFIPLYHFHPLTNIQIFICNFACEMTITYF